MIKWTLGGNFLSALRSSWIKCFAFSAFIISASIKLSRSGDRQHAKSFPELSGWTPVYSSHCLYSDSEWPHWRGASDFHLSHGVHRKWKQGENMKYKICASSQTWGEMSVLFVEYSDQTSIWADLWIRQMCCYLLRVSQ